MPDLTMGAGALVRVTRCKDCIHNGLFDCPLCYIEKRTLQFIEVSPDFYCGKGEREIEPEPEHCAWCEPGHELCGTCKKFFDYYDDGGSDRCSGECYTERCTYYEPMPNCPNCGAKMDGGESNG